MKILLPLVPALLFASAALGQQVAEESAKDLWCSIAFGIVTADVPADVSDEQRAMVDQFANGGIMLFDRAHAVYLEAGYTEESFAAHVETLTAEVDTQVRAADNSATYSFEECSALLGL